jgi:uncharacterized damage-inducible protein DinB
MNLQQYTTYNLWANRTICEKLQSIDAELLDVDNQSSFPSIRKTVFHIWDAESIWLDRLNGRPIAHIPSRDLPADTAIDRFLETSKSFADFVATKPNAFFDTDIAFTAEGNEHSMQASPIIWHCMNHSTFHRGQLVTMLRQAGITEIPGTDLTKYVRLGQD